MDDETRKVLSGHVADAQAFLDAAKHRFHLNLGDQRSAPITELILEYALVVKDLVALYDEHQTSLDEILASVEKSKKQQESIQASLATELKAAREKSDHDTQKLAEDRRSMEQEFTNKEAQLSQTHREKCASVETRRSELESEYQLKKEGLDAEYREKESAITERSKELTDRIKQSDSELQSKKTALQTEYETKRQDLEASAAESKAKLEEAERLLKAREVSFEAKVAVEDEVQKKLTALTSNLEQLTINQQSATEKISTLSKDKADREVLEAQQRILKGDLAKANDSIATLKNWLSSATATIHARDAEISRARQTIKNRNAERSGLSSQLAASESAKSAVEAQRMSLETQLHEAQERVASLDITVRRLEAENNALGASNSGLQEQVELIPELQRQADRVPGLELQVAKIANLEAQVATIAGLEQQVQTIPGFKSQVARIEGLEAQVAKIPNLEAQVARIPGLEEQVATIADLKSRAEIVNSLTQQLSNETSLREASSKENAELDKEVERLRVVEAKTAQLEKAKTEIESTAQALRDEIKTHEENAKHKDETIKSLRLQLERFGDGQSSNPKKRKKDPKSPEAALSNPWDSVMKDISQLLNGIILDEDTPSSCYPLLLQIISDSGKFAEYRRYLNQPPRKRESWTCLRCITTLGYRMADTIDEDSHCQACIGSHEYDIHVKGATGKTLLRMVNLAFASSTQSCSVDPNP